MPAVSRLLPVALLAFAVAGCASPPAQERMGERLRGGDAERALEAIDAWNAGGRNEVLVGLERGMLLRRQGRLAESIEAFEATKRQLGDLEPISVSETLAEWTLAESAGAYQASVHERLLLHSMQILNFLESGDLDAARVEATQADLTLRRIDPGRGAAPYGGDASLRYLSGIVFEAAGERSDAAIAYRHAVRRYRDRDTPVPRDLQHRLVRLLGGIGLDDEQAEWLERFGLDEVPEAPPAEWGELIVVVHGGLAPRLGQTNIAAQDPRSGQLYRLSMPKVQRAGDPVRGLRVTSGGESASGDRIESVNGLVEAWVDQQVPLLISRALGRNVVRHQVASRLREENPALGALVNVVGFLAEQPDQRLWRSLPESLWLVRLPLPSGSHRPRVHVGRGGGDERRLTLDGPVRIRPGETVVRSLYRP